MEDYCSVWHYEITQSQHCNNDNNDNMMHAGLWFEFFGDYSNAKTHGIWKENVRTRRRI
jgi:hypothetical protein